MIKGTFQYALLQYHHSQLLGEVLNVGLVAYFPEHKRLEFIFPEKLIRLRYTYPEVPEKTIKSYFRYFQDRVVTLNKSPNLFYDQDLEHGLQQFLEKEFLAPDASSLQFGNYRNSVLYTQNIQQICDQLYNLYFSVFKIQDSTIKKIDESILLRKYKNQLSKFTKNSSLNEVDNLYFNYSIKPDSGASVKFDIAWKEDKNTHLVKPVSFDLQRPESIQRKAWQYLGQFEDLHDLAVHNDYLFDVILAKPKSKDLVKPYDNAIRLLSKPGRVNLIELDELQKYAQLTVDSILEQ